MKLSAQNELVIDAIAEVYMNIWKNRNLSEN